MLLNALQELQKRVRTLELSATADPDEVAALRKDIAALAKETTRNTTKLGLYAALGGIAAGAIVSYAVAVYAAPAPPPPQTPTVTDRRSG